MTINKSKRLVSPLGKARGLGSAHEGVHHWLQERITGALLVPLSFWIVWSMITLQGVSYAEFSLWLQNPLNAVLMLTFVITSFFHGAMGLQVVIEDYVAGLSTRLLLIIFTKIIFAILGLAAVFAILKVTFA